jgi:hypothetical protein
MRVEKRKERTTRNGNFEDRTRSITPPPGAIGSQNTPISSEVDIVQKGARV